MIKTSYLFTQHTMSHLTSDNSTGTSHVAVIAPEEENYLRIAHLLVRVAPSAVRVKFNYEFHPDGLKKILNQNRSTALYSLKRQKVINQTQWDLLFPMSGKHSKSKLIFKKEYVFHYS